MQHLPHLQRTTAIIGATIHTTVRVPACSYSHDQACATTAIAPRHVYALNIRSNQYLLQMSESHPRRSAGRIDKPANIWGPWAPRVAARANMTRQ